MIVVVVELLKVWRPEVNCVDCLQHQLNFVVLHRFKLQNFRAFLGANDESQSGKGHKVKRVLVVAHQSFIV
jgi:hypothetical protein